MSSMLAGGDAHQVQARLVPVGFGELDYSLSGAELRGDGGRVGRAHCP